MLHVLLEHNFSHNAVVLKVMLKNITYKFLRIMNLTLGCEFTKPTKSRAHLSLRQVRFESSAPFTGMSLGNYGTVFGIVKSIKYCYIPAFSQNFYFLFHIRDRQARKSK